MRATGTDPHSSPNPEPEREPVSISGEGWDRMVAEESDTRTLGSM